MSKLIANATWTIDGAAPRMILALEVWDAEHDGAWDLVLAEDVPVEWDGSEIGALEDVLYGYGFDCPNPWGTTRIPEERMMEWWTTVEARKGE